MIRTITGRELKALAEDIEDDALVVFAADYGDRCHTEQALAIRGEVERVEIADSAYSSSGYAIAQDESDNVETDVEIVVIR